MADTFNGRKRIRKKFGSIKEVAQHVLHQFHVARATPAQK